MANKYQFNVPTFKKHAGRQFLAGINELLEIKKFKLLPMFAKWESGKECLGWDGDGYKGFENHVFILPVIARQWMDMILGGNDLNNISYKSLYKQLAKVGITGIFIQNGDEGNQVYVLMIPKSLLPKYRDTCHRCGWCKDSVENGI
jgi:hypothetical protein